MAECEMASFGAFLVSPFALLRFAYHSSEEPSPPANGGRLGANLPRWQYCHRVPNFQRPHEVHPDKGFLCYLYTTCQAVLADELSYPSDRSFRGVSSIERPGRGS